MLIMMHRVLSLLISIIVIFSSFQDVYGANEGGTGHLIINQVYGGAAANNSTSVSHSFVELYNPTGQTVSIDGWSIQYVSSGSEWQVLPLKGQIPPDHSFLVRGNESNRDARLKVNDYDMLWDVYFNNKGLKVALVSNIKPLSCINPFADKADGYVDMLGVAGSNVENYIDGFETDYLKAQSKQKSLRRINFKDTDNNAKDFEVVDYTEAPLEDKRPRSLKDGAWTQVSSSEKASEAETENAAELAEAAEETKAEVKYFNDLRAESPYFSSVNMLSKLGIINKEPLFNSDGLIKKSDFYSWLFSARGMSYSGEKDDSSISLNDAVEASLMQLGYSPIIKNVNGNIMRIAKDEGLLKNIALEAQDTLTRGDAAFLIRNALEVYNITETKMGKSTEYTQLYKTWLTDIHKVTKVDGIITDRPYYTSAANRDKVSFVTKFGEEIKGIIGADSETEALLGYNVTAYIKNIYENSNAGTAEMILAEKTNKNRELIIKKSWYIGVTGVNGGVINFSYNDDTVKGYKEIKISENAEFVYNDALCDSMRKSALNMDKNAFKPSHTGNITLLDYNEDNIYDYIFVTNYKDIVVSGIDKKNYIITNKLKYDSATSDSLDKYDEISRITLDPDSSDYRLRILDSNNNPLKFSDITKDSVVSVGVSSFGTEDIETAIIRNVYVSNSTKAGLITESYLDNGDINFVVDGKAYEASKSYNMTFEGGDSDVSSFFGVGDYVTFYLNYDKKICFVIVNKQELEYAILLNISDQSSLGQTREIALLDKEQNLRILKISNKQYQNYKLGALTLPSVVKAAIFNDSLINMKTRLDEKGVHMDYSAEYQYKLNSSRLGDLFLDDGTVLFVYSGSRGDENAKDSDYYNVIDKSMLGNVKKLDADVYDVEENYKPGLLVIYTPDNDFYKSDIVAGVEKVTKGIDSLGNLSTYVYCASGSELERYPLSEGFRGTAPKEKNVIQFSLNKKGEIYAFKTLYGGSTADVAIGNVFDDDFYAIRTHVAGVKDDILTVTSGGRYENYKSNEDTKVYIIYKDNYKNIEPYYFDSILYGSKVLIYQKDGFLHDVFVIE